MQTSNDLESSELAKTVLFLAIRRREIIYSAKSRVECVLQLIKLIHERSKIIVFGERIEYAELIYKRINDAMPGQVALYHSRLNHNTRKSILRKYQDLEIRILVTCRTMDEGLNVVKTDVGIIASSTNSERQKIQRLGRILRKSGKLSYLYYLYIDKSSEETQMLQKLSQRLSRLVQIIDIDYDEKSQCFINTIYDGYVANVWLYMMKREVETKIILEAERHMKKGMITCDWLQNEKWLFNKLKEAESKEMRNYYSSMLLVARARLGKLN